MLQDLIAISRSDELWKVEVQVNGTSQVGWLRVGLVDDGYNLMLRIETGRSRCFRYQVPFLRSQLAQRICSDRRD